jgi:hypothetical protein
MTKDVAPMESAALLERVIVGGNLAELKPAERLMYYKAVCESVGLNPLTKPFDYLHLNGRLVLYAKKEATDQLRSLPQHAVSITKLERESSDGCYIVTAYATHKTGRTDSAIGAVNIDQLRGEAKANAIMKAETKAKRRVTLSICGLGVMDESEVEDALMAATLRETQTKQPEAAFTTGEIGVTPQQEELSRLIDEATRLQKIIRLPREDLDALKLTHLGTTDIFQADIAAMKALVDDLKAREPKKPK